MGFGSVSGRFRFRVGFGTVSDGFGTVSVSGSGRFRVGFGTVSVWILTGFKKCLLLDQIVAFLDCFLARHNGEDHFGSF